MILRSWGLSSVILPKERCSGFACINSFSQKIDAFIDYPKELDILAVAFSCGGCPGRRIGRLVENLIKRAKKAEIERRQIVIHLASCMVTDNAHYPLCPHLDLYYEDAERKGPADKTGQLQRPPGPEAAGWGVPRGL
jgi:predicted metal-binding protein